MRVPEAELLQSSTQKNIRQICLHYGFLKQKFDRSTYMKYIPYINTDVGNIGLARGQRRVSRPNFCRLEQKFKFDFSPWTISDRWRNRCSLTGEL